MHTLVDQIQVQKDILSLITPEQAWHHHIVPKSFVDNQLELYIDEDKLSDTVLEELDMIFGHLKAVHPLPSPDVRNILNQHYKRTFSNAKRVSVEGTKADGFLEELIGEAKNLGSSDIHIEIYNKKARVRIRIDGILVERYSLELDQYPSLINRIKIKSNLDIAEKRLPQDGRIEFNEGALSFDIRVSILPTLHGEKVVLRLLNRDATDISYDSLGMGQTDQQRFLQGVRKPHGIVLISGPTGSGKTTTLYATLKILNEEKRNILTVEDPVEYTLEGINQVQLKEGIGLTFAAALRSFLRQDPDVIMLGEIRDGETAEMAVRAALTGHLVLSTIHTNSAWGTISRLIDMGVPPFLLANTINTTVAQRLLRKLCPDCKSEQAEKLEWPNGFNHHNEVESTYKAVGCPNCFHTGYQGRTAIYEAIPIDQELGDAIKNNSSNIDKLLEDRGIQSLAQQAFELLKQGVTSFDEAYPILSSHS